MLLLSGRHVYLARRVQHILVRSEESLTISIFRSFAQDYGIPFYSIDSKNKRELPGEALCVFKCLPILDYIEENIYLNIK